MQAAELRLSSTPFFRAESAIRGLFIRGHPVVVAWSGGKDSSVVLGLTLSAAASLETPLRTPLIVLTSDTGIENPEIAAYRRREIVSLRRFCERKGIGVEVRVAQPDLSSHWPVKVIGSGALPIFPDSRQRRCTVDLKIKPMERLRREVLAGLPCDRPPVTLVGTRFSESASRQRRMAERGEEDGLPWTGRSGELFLSPIARWTADDVWEYLMLAKEGHVESYSDFEDLFRVYQDSSDT